MADHGDHVMGDTTHDAMTDARIAGRIASAKAATEAIRLKKWTALGLRKLIHLDGLSETERDQVRTEITRRRKAYAKRWYEADPAHREKVRADQRRWRSANPEWHRFSGSLHRYGITLDQYHALAERQDFLCAICGSDGPLVIDHCHDTAVVRGLLCQPCNGGIGVFRHSRHLLDRAAAFVSAPRAWPITRTNPQSPPARARRTSHVA